MEAEEHLSGQNRCLCVTRASGESRQVKPSQRYAERRRQARPMEAGGRRRESEQKMGEAVRDVQLEYGGGLVYAGGSAVRGALPEKE